MRYSGFVEPLIDKNIFNLIKMLRNNLPKVNIEMVTNGDPLNLKRLNKLFENNGLSVKFFRRLGLSAVSRSKTIKKIFMKYAMGI